VEELEKKRRGRGKSRKKDCLMLVASPNRAGKKRKGGGERVHKGKGRGRALVVASV